MSTLTMVQCIDEAKKGRKLCEIKELVLDGCNATEIEGLNDEYSCLEMLSIANAGLTTIAGLPKLPSLKKLNLAGNPINAGLEALDNCPSLTSLNLSGNKLVSVSDLKPLASLEFLTHLELNGSELVGVDGHRAEVFALLPHLKFLDGLDKDGVEETSSKHNGEAVNGAKNGHVAASGDAEDGDEDQENEDEEEEEDDEEDEIGISALQGSKDLEDDEEDYVPGEEPEEDEEEEDEEESEEDEDEEQQIANEIANLSEVNVDGPRRAPKRAAAEGEDDEAPEAKVPATEQEEDN